MIRMGDTNVFTVKDLAELFNVNPDTIRRYIKSGDILAKKFANKWIITEEAMREFLLNKADNYQPGKLGNADNQGNNNDR